MQQIVIGLVSFWISNEYTWGAMEDYDYKNLQNGMTIQEQKLEWAYLSRESVLANEKFQQIFGEFAEAIGLHKEQKV